MSLKYTACLIAAALMASVFFSVKTSHAASAEDNYKFYCAQCHGLEGRGDGPNATRHQPVDPRDHTNAYEMSKITDEDIIEAITDGGAATSKSTLMPPFGSTLTREEVSALKDYIRKLCNCTAR